MEPCPQCGEQVWGFVQQPLDRSDASWPVAPPNWPVTVFPCGHIVSLAVPEPSAG